MECISISFKSAPEEIRRIFVFTQEEKKQLLEQAEQAVLLATCNRTEIYATGKESAFSGIGKAAGGEKRYGGDRASPDSKTFSGEKGVGASVQSYLRYGLHGAGGG